MNFSNEIQNKWSLGLFHCLMHKIHRTRRQYQDAVKPKQKFLSAAIQDGTVRVTRSPVNSNLTIQGCTGDFTFCTFVPKWKRLTQKFLATNMPKRINVQKPSFYSAVIKLSFLYAATLLIFLKENFLRLF